MGVFQATLSIMGKRIYIRNFQKKEKGRHECYEYLYMLYIYSKNSEIMPNFG